VNNLRSFAVLDTEHEEAFDRITRLAAGLLDVPIALISLVDGERQWFKSRVGLDATETPRELAFCAHAIQGDILFTVKDATDDERFSANPLVTGQPNIRFYAGAPLKSEQGYNLGTLCIIDRVPRVLDDRQRELLEDLAGLAVRELELRKAASIDGLTGVFNRSALLAAAKSEFARARRYDTDLSLGIIDVDHFKLINDNWGHGGGDVILRGIAQACQSSIREGDVVGRIGGDEFAVLFPRASAEFAAKIMLRIQTNLRAAAFLGGHTGAVPTLSVGIAQVQPDDSGLLATWERADAAAYLAKRTRDAVVCG